MNFVEIKEKEFSIDLFTVSLGDATELTLGNGCDTFENFGCKWCK